MNFGNVLNELITLTKHRNSTISNYLGYDVSYISKWINSSKLPSSKNIEYIIEKLCDLFITQSDMKTIELICEQFHLKDSFKYKTDEEIKNYVYLEVENILKGTYESQNIKQSYPATNINTPNTTLSINNKELNFTLLESIRYYCNKSNCKNIDIILTTNMSKFINTESIESIFNDKIQIFNKKIVTVNQIINIDDFNKNINKYCKTIILYLGDKSGVNLNLYKTDKCINQPLIIVKDCLASYSIKDEISNITFNNLTKDKHITNTLFTHYKNMIKNFSPIFKTSNIVEFENKNLFINFLIQPSVKYFINEIPLFLLSKDILDSLYHKNIINYLPNEYNQTIYNHDFDSNISILMFKSTLIDYILNGNLIFEGCKFTISIDDRISHINLLIDTIKSKPNFSIRILEDDNPYISIYNFKNPLFLSNKTGFFVTGSYHNRLVHKIIDIDILNNFISFYDAVWSDNLFVEKDTIGFLRKTLNILYFTYNNKRM